MERVVGMGCIVISAVAFGMMPLFANVAYQAGATPVSVLFLRFGIAALVLLGITIKTQAVFPRGKSLLILVLMGAVGYAGQSLSYFTALQFAPAGLVAILLYIGTIRNATWGFRQVTKGITISADYDHHSLVDYIPRKLGSVFFKKI